MTTSETNDFSALDFYTRFYDALPRSPAYAELCRRLYNANLGQHGFADMDQLHALLDAVQLRLGERGLDIGCGDGRMAEYISDRTGARITGLDLIPTGITRAVERTASKRDRLEFVAGDIGALDRLFAPASFEVLIAIDSLYFTDLADTIRQMKTVLGETGRMGIFYSHAANPWQPAESFPRETLHPDSGPLSAALRANGLAYRWWDFTEADYRNARRKKAIIEALRPAYETEEDRVLCEGAMGEAEGVIAAHEAGAHARHLFLAWA
ncbi:MAG: class I SAM-dependent methyltransferase [Nitrososphaerales archaeon]